MSYELAVWFPHKRIDDGEAGQLYERLCEGQVDRVTEHPAIEVFYLEITSRYPEIGDMRQGCDLHWGTETPGKVSNNQDDTQIDCPWVGPFDRSPGHIIMHCVTPKAEYVGRLVHQLARKHGLCVFDPQAARVTYPDGLVGSGVNFYLKRAREIVIADFLAAHDTHGYIDRLYTAEVNVVRVLKGQSKPGNLRVVTNYAMRTGARYLLCSLGSLPSFEATSALSVVAMPDQADLGRFDDMSLRDELVWIFETRLLQVRRELAQKEEEQKLLEKALGRPAKR